MFEQNGRCGYVLKPSVMWDKSHVMYNHFNPWDKEFEGLHATIFTLHVCLNFLNFCLFESLTYPHPLNKKNTQGTSTCFTL